MHFLISGAAGFIGSHLCDRLLAEGHAVTGLDNLVTGSRDNLAHLAGHERFGFLLADVTEPVELDRPVDFVLHLASPASPVHYLSRPIATLLAGSLGTRNLLELARRDRARFLLASTSECYGDPLEHPQKETYWGHVNPVGPRSCYDESKRFAEALTMAYHREHGLATYIVRIFNTYGPRMQSADGRMVPTFIAQALRGEPLTVNGDGLQTRSLCYIDDLVDGIRRLLDTEERYPVNLGNPAEITVIDFARMVVRLTGSRSPIHHRPLPEDDPRRRCPDVSKARRLLGWAPTTSLEEGLARTIEYFRSAL